MLTRLSGSYLFLLSQLLIWACLICWILSYRLRRDRADLHHLAVHMRESHKGAMHSV